MTFFGSLSRSFSVIRPLRRCVGRQVRLSDLYAACPSLRKRVASHGGLGRLWVASHQPLGTRRWVIAWLVTNWLDSKLDYNISYKPRPPWTIDLWCFPVIGDTADGCEILHPGSYWELQNTVNFMGLHWDVYHLLAGAGFLLPSSVGLVTRILYDIKWYYMILNDIILYDIKWYYMILKDIIWYYMIFDDIKWYYMILYDIIWYDMILYDIKRILMGITDDKIEL